jgi:hypothetical protein
MASEYERVCVKWRDMVTGEVGWCAVDGKLDPLAFYDKTLCSMSVTLRIGSEKRTPTCQECLEVLRRRKSERNKRHEKKRRQ